MIWGTPILENLHICICMLDRQRAQSPDRCFLSAPNSALLCRVDDLSKLLWRGRQTVTPYLGGVLCWGWFYGYNHGILYTVSSNMGIQLWFCLTTTSSGTVARIIATHMGRWATNVGIWRGLKTIVEKLCGSRCGWTCSCNQVWTLQGTRVNGPISDSVSIESMRFGTSMHIYVYT